MSSTRFFLVQSFVLLVPFEISAEGSIETECLRLVEVEAMCGSHRPATDLNHVLVPLFCIGVALRRSGTVGT